MSAAHTAAVGVAAHMVVAHIAVEEVGRKLVVGEQEHIAVVGVAGERTSGSLLLAFGEHGLQWWSLSGTCAKSLRRRRGLR